MRRAGPSLQIRQAGVTRGLALAGALMLMGCSGASLPSPSRSLGPVTPAPSPGAFACPAQDLAGSPPTSRLANVTVTSEADFDRVTFVFEPGPSDRPAEASGLIVRPVGVVPRKKADGTPLAVAGDHYLEVRFRDMALDGAQGTSAFRGPRDLTAATGGVREVVEIEESSLALDWLIGTTTECVRVWQDGDTRLLVDVQR